jgi:5-methylcytosine-specific restriction endonuclease McrA
MKQCVKCGSTNSLTKDHIIPRWFLKSYLLITKQSFKTFLRVRAIHQWNNLQVMCLDCNQAKQGTLDSSNEITRGMIKEIIAILQDNLEQK